jgi:Ni/Co efflux regulator RcnB
MKTRNTLFVALLAAAAVAPAFADKGGHGQGHGNGGHGHGRGFDNDHDRVVIIDHDDGGRGLRAGGCPPGLAKKNNGCLPPGQAKKLAVGQPIPAGAVYVIPRNVRNTLPPAPAGYRYAVVNNQVVLVSSGNIVVDIIRSLLG